MLAYLQKRLGHCTKGEDPGDSEDEEKFNESDEPEKDKQLKKDKPRCLLGCGDFTTKYRLTEHVKQQHADSFTQEFPCPECKRFGSKVQVPLAWRLGAVILHDITVAYIHPQRPMEHRPAFYAANAA
uniref:Uncharacterized protein n=1 Tax=Bionectria ochroleuca TaxID=29856 RepID=A0A8H7K5W6_BIOOC